MLTPEQREASAGLNDMARMAIDSESGFFATVGFAALSLGDQRATRAHAYATR